MANLSCPECGGDVEEISENLTNLGYKASDKTMLCEDCGHTFARGEPIGEFNDDVVSDTECDVCDTGTGLLYQIKHHDREDGVLVLRLKCDNCYYVWTKKRQFDDNGVITVGYGAVLGEKTEERGTK